MYLKSAISRSFCQGYMITGAKGGPIVFLLLLKIVVPMARSFSMVALVSLVAFTRQSRAYQSPLVEVQ